MPSADLVGIFAAELKNVGGKCHLVSTADEALNRILGIVRDTGAKVVARTALPSIDTSKLDYALLDMGVRLIDTSSSSDPLPLLKGAEIGVTEAKLGIAESGTIMEYSEYETDRLVSTLPYVHVAVLRSDWVVRSLRDSSDHIKRISLQAFKTGKSHVVSLITGPSRTADVEQRLVRGVHGPNETHVIILGA